MANRARKNQPGNDAKTPQQMRDELNITVDLIPRSNSNRPGTPLHPTKITIHNTDNDEPGADARAHCRYQKGDDAQRRQVSWHFSVDDHSIYQSLPVDEVGWHAGTHEGNANSIGIEICENRGIDQAAANDRAAKLTAAMLHELGISPGGNVVQHHDWSGKDCPRLLRHPATGWTAFLQNVANYYNGITDNGHENDHAALAHFLAAPGPEQVEASPQANIVSTEFGGGNEAGMPSAYGGTVDPNRPQASLPARVPRSKRQIRVSNPANGRSVVCLVNDVGPWNTHDAYWDNGRRPAAESQHQNHQPAENGHVPSNAAGLDLTPAAMLALGVAGPINTRQVTVNWQFV
jgi:hypothetical protein